MHRAAHRETRSEQRALLRSKSAATRKTGPTPTTTILRCVLSLVRGDGIKDAVLNVPHRWEIKGGAAAPVKLAGGES